MDNLGALKRGCPGCSGCKGARPTQRLMQQQVLYVTKGSKKDTKLAKGCKAVEDEPELWAEVNTADTCTLDLAREGIEVEEE